MDSDAGQLLDEVENSLERVHVRADLCDLRPDVLVHPDDLDMRQGRRQLVLLERPLGADPKLALLETRRDIRVGLGIDVRVDA